jgi:hypothetical protein
VIGAMTGLRGLANLGYSVCHQTIGNVLQRHGLPPAPCYAAGLRISEAVLPMLVPQACRDQAPGLLLPLVSAHHINCRLSASPIAHGCFR